MNILKSIILSILLISVASCEVQKLDLTDEQLAALIADMHISEISLERHEDHLKDSLQEVYLSKLEIIHHVDRAQIKTEVEALMQDRKRQSDIYIRAIGLLQELEKKVKKVKSPTVTNKNKGNE